MPTEASHFYKKGSLSWTDTLPGTAHADLFRTTAWADTLLGPLEDWGPALRLYTSMLFADSRGGVIWWGPQRVAIYNEHYIPFVGQRHPDLMGRPLNAVFSEVNEQIEGLFQQAFLTGTAVQVHEMQFLLQRNDYLEETYFTGHFVPVKGDSGRTEGIFNTSVECTDAVVGARYRRAVDDVAALVSQLFEDTTTKILDALQRHPLDVPMLVLYTYDQEAGPGGNNLQLQGRISVPEQHPCAIKDSCLESSSTGIIPYLRQAKSLGRPIVLKKPEGASNGISALFDGIKWAGYGEDPREMVIVPLYAGDTLRGFYVQGINPRRAFDESMGANVLEMARQVGLKRTASEVEQRRQLLELKATQSESILNHMAESAPIGMAQISLESEIVWANDQFYDMLGIDPGDRTSFMTALAEEDRSVAERNLHKLLTGQTDQTVAELRLKRTWRPPVPEDKDVEPSSAYILSYGFVSREHDRITGLMCYSTDISHQKWVEGVQSRNATAALQAKRTQEEFIDMVSHEARNPLSAISQLADGIRTCAEGADGTNETYQAILEENVESATTILACAAHQRRVIDDVLIISRLESEMLSITPVAERPEEIVNKAIRMFSGECASEEIYLEAVQDDSYHNLTIDFVLVDSSRLMQVLINFLSNAIKFTRSQAKRHIAVVYGAQALRPPSITTIFGDLNWISLGHRRQPNSSLPSERRSEEKLYLYFCVQDTGTGMTAIEMHNLFQKFTQATPKTHIKYGGSGLGLYICRQLAEKQGGNVGVASKDGEGSVFGFYIETMVAQRSDLSIEQQRAPRLGVPRARASNRTNMPQRGSSGANRSAINSLGTQANTEASQPEEVREEQRQNRTVSQSDIPPQEFDSRQFSVLLVEDNLVNQRVLAKQLRKKRCHVTVANDGLEALAILKKFDCWQGPSSEEDSPHHIESSDIDVILMDWEMPNMNGLDCARRIREVERQGQISKRLKIIATTANVRQEQKEQAVAAGMDTVMSKPFTVGEVLERIRKIVDDVTDEGCEEGG